MTVEVRLHVPHGGVGQVVLREELQQVLHVVDRVFLVVGQVVGHAGLGVVGLAAAKVLERHLFARDGLDDVGAGDEHLRRAVRHDDEVGEGGGVHGAAGARAKDDGDLRDDAGGGDVAAEDLGELGERRDALLNARAAAVGDADEWHAGAQREVLHLGDLVAVDLAQRAAEHGEVLRVHGHLAAVDGAVAGDDAVAEGTVLFQAKSGGAVAREGVELDERALVKQQLDALARGLLAARVLLLLSRRLRRLDGGGHLVAQRIERGRGGLGVWCVGHSAPLVNSDTA